MSDNAAGWQPDPTGKHDHRYWDGTGWTDNVADAGVAEHRPLRSRRRAAEPTVVTPVAGVEDTTASYPTATTASRTPLPPYVPPIAGGRWRRQRRRRREQARLGDRWSDPGGRGHRGGRVPGVLR